MRMVSASIDISVGRIAIQSREHLTICSRHFGGPNSRVSSSTGLYAVGLGLMRYRGGVTGKMWCINEPFQKNHIKFATDPY